MAYIIGEIGINHNGDLEKAKALIYMASTFGFDAVKFQKRNPDVCVPEDKKNEIRQTPWGEMTYLDYKKKIEFNKDDYNSIDNTCIQLGIEWSASPWDMDSLDFLDKYNLPWIKLSSAAITDLEMIKECAIRYDWVIMSTGMSSMSQVREAVDTAKSACMSGKLTLLHCNSAYPAPVDELNLNCIKRLAEEFPDCEVGYSGHEYGLTTSIASVALGAKVVERHITLDKTMWGTDQMCSVEPHGMLKLSRGIRELESALGNGIKKISGAEMEKAASQRK
jgi:sialic acid synthase SpsE